MPHEIDRWCTRPHRMIESRAWRWSRSLDGAGSSPAPSRLPQERSSRPGANGAKAAPAAPHRFVSRPDLRPPVVAVTTTSETASAGHIFIAPFQITGKAGAGYGALIVDRLGQPIWFKPETKLTAMNLRVQRYQGKPVDHLVRGRRARRLRRRLHRRRPELPRDRARQGGTRASTATCTSSCSRSRHRADHDLLEHPVRSDTVGGSASGQLTEGVIQEIDVATGKVLIEWRSSAHVGLDESYPPERQGRRRRLLPPELGRRRQRRAPARVGAARLRDLQAAPARPARSSGGSAEAQRLHDRPGRRVLVPARRAPSRRRHADDLRQQRGRAHGDDASRGRCGSRST